MAQPGAFLRMWFIHSQLAIPFYVGQSKRLSGRIHDYHLKNFEACTDFRVGKVIEYPQETKNYGVIAKYKASQTPRKMRRRLSVNFY